MKPFVLTAVLALLATPVAALAQDVVSTAPVQDVVATAPVQDVVATAPAEAPATATPTAAVGLSPAAVVQWLGTQGVTPGAVEQDGDNSYVRVVDGPLTWILFFQSCSNGVCADLQFSVGFATRAVTPEVVNGWNRDRRFLKAFYEASTTAGETASAVVQYDLFLRPGVGPEQLADHLAVWRGLAPEFARLVVPPAGTTPAAKD